MIYEKELSERIIGFAFKVYNELGKGFLEKVYENSLVHLMRKDGINCKAQEPINVYFDGINVGQYFADIFVENKIILELKVCEKIRPEHEAQLTKFHRTFSRCSSLTLSVHRVSVLTLSVLIFMGIGG